MPGIHAILEFRARMSEVLVEMSAGGKTRPGGAMNTRWMKPGVLALAWVLALASGARAQEVNCADGLDNDGDFLTDCADPDCSRDIACEVSATRNLDVVRDDPGIPSTSWQNIYLFSWPEIPNIADVADAGAFGDRCVAGPDGVVDSTDALCLLWNSAPHRTGDSMGLGRFNRSTCLFEMQIVIYGGIGTAFSGTSFALDRVEGYWVGVNASRVPPPTRSVILAGWSDRSWPGDAIALPSPMCRPALMLLHLPFDMMYRTADEFLCGLNGVDWVDANGDGNPDTCSRGIFDGFTPISVETFDNDPSAAPTGDLRSNNWPVARSVLMTDLGLQFLGPDFAVGPGDAVLVQIRDEHVQTLFSPPRF